MNILNFRHIPQKLNDLLNFNKDDPLRLVRWTTTDLGQISILKKLLLLGLTYNVSFFLIEIIYFSLNFELKQFIQFFSLNIGALHGYMASWVCLAYEKVAYDQAMCVETDFVKLSRVKTSTHKRILKAVVLRRYAFLLNLLFLHLLYFFFWPIFGYEDEYYFPVYFLNEYIKPVFGKLVVNALRTFFYITMYTYISSAGVQVHTCFYMLSQMEFQMIIVEDNILDIGNMVTKSGGIHQRRVNENLKDCIRHYLIIFQSMEQMKSWIFWPMAITLIGSLVMLLSFVYFVIAQASLEAFPRVLSLSGTTICSLAIYALCGQGLKDQCERVNNSLYLLPWFRYNKKNCELLRLFMVATNTPLHLSLLGFVDVDMILVMKVYKFVFSSFATIQQVVALKNREG